MTFYDMFYTILFNYLLAKTNMYLLVVIVLYYLLIISSILQMLEKLFNILTGECK